MDGKDDTWKDSDSTIEKDHTQKTDGNEYRIDYEEHMMPLTELAEAFQTEIDFNNPKNSPGLKPLQVNLLQSFVIRSLSSSHLDHASLNLFFVV